MTVSVNEDIFKDSEMTDEVKQFVDDSDGDDNDSTSEMSTHAD